MGPLVRVCWLAVVLVGAVIARPSADISTREARGQTITDASDPVEEARGQVQTLAYYGGAKGQYLVIHPSGRRTVSRTPPPIKGSPSKPPKEEEEDVGMAEEEEGDNESVAINPPPDNASVAEAKPVGLAIAGPGGVASSKPVAQAIVGPGGLAVARPVATAIAGVRGGGIPGAIAVSGKEEEPSARQYPQQIFFDPQTNRLHATPTPGIGTRYLFPVHLY